MQIPKRVVDAYEIGPILATKLISSGLIHQTYQIRAKKGMYIFQRLHPVLSSEGIAADFLAVTRFLASKKFPAPRAILNKQGELLTSDGERVWRVQTFLTGKTYHELKNAAMAREAGSIIARLHKTFDKMEYRFKSDKILHETEKIYAAFKKTVKAHYGSGLIDDVAPELEFVAKELPKLFLPKMPLRVIHGDPKVSNILFDSKGKASSIVDLDTCNRRPLLVELGDAFRSWCGKKEDDPKNQFRLEIFEAAWKGYAKGAKGFISKQEMRYVPQAIGTITLELTARFLTDYFNDNYFGWDPKKYASRREHNLARARGQLALYRDLQKKMKDVKAIVA
jgi:Ser/Thr protein kinase RdoA (MazF antagonist)